VFGPDWKKLIDEAAQEQAQFELGHSEPYDEEQRKAAIAQRVTRKLGRVHKRTAQEIAKWQRARLDYQSR
jgi:hypothetical protein